MKYLNKIKNFFNGYKNYPNESIENEFTKKNVKLFGVPYILEDNVLSKNLIDKINFYWPSFEHFSKEVPGMNILQLYNNRFKTLDNEQKQFWSDFYYDVWVEVLANISQSFSQIGLQVFDEVCMKDIRLDWPLTLMEADSSYLGHNIHTHYYHCPHWYFTVLFYIDSSDTDSKGTTLHLMRNDNNDSLNSYDSADTKTLASFALNWNNYNNPFSELKLNSNFIDKTSEFMKIKFQPNRLFAFLDGPLSFHSVEKSNQKNNKRRVMRSHVKVHHPLFYNKHSTMLKCDFDPSLYMKVCGPHTKLSEDEKIFKNKYVVPFYEERISTYQTAINEFFNNQKTENILNDKNLIINNLKSNLPLK